MRSQEEQQYKDKLKCDPAGARDFVFCDVSQGSKRGWNYILAYNDWLNQR